MAVDIVAWQDTRSNGNNMWYGRAVNLNKAVKLKDLSEQVARNTNSTRGEVVGIITNFEAVIKRLLLDSNKVKLGSLGTLRLCIAKQKPGVTEDKFSANNILAYRIRGFMHSSTTAISTRAEERKIVTRKAIGATR